MYNISHSFHDQISWQGLMDTVLYLIQSAPSLLPLDHLALYLALLILSVYYVWPNYYTIKQLAAS